MVVSTSPGESQEDPALFLLSSRAWEDKLETKEASQDNINTQKNSTLGSWC